MLRVKQRVAVTQGVIDMNKTLIMGAAIAAALTLGAQRASAYCLDLSPSGFCDLVEVDVVDGVVFGIWESDCDGVPDTTVGGTTDFGTGNFAGDSWKDGVHLFVWTVNIGARTTDFWQTDGTTATQWFNDLTTSLSPGACPFTIFATSVRGTPISQSAPSR